MHALVTEPGQLCQIPINLIYPDPEQPRKHFDASYIKELAESIKVDGLIQPIVVRVHPEKPGAYMIISGENRYRACKTAKLSEIQAITREVDGLNKLLIQIKENCQRQDLNPIDWAKTIETIHLEHKLSLADMAHIFKEAGIKGLSRPVLSNTMRLLTLPDNMQALIEDGTITTTHGRVMLTAMASDKVKEDVFQYVVNNPNISTADLQDYIYAAYGEFHTQLTNNANLVPFNHVEECVSCSNHRKKVSGLCAEDTFCLNRDCFEQKRDEHYKAKENNANERKLASAEDGNGGPADVTYEEEDEDPGMPEPENYRLIRNATFDTHDCYGCSDCAQVETKGHANEDLPPEEACFNVDCWNEKTKAANTAKQAERDCEQSILAWATDEIGALAPKSAGLTRGIIAYAAAGETGQDGGVDYELLINGKNLFEKLTEANALSITEFLAAASSNIDNMLVQHILLTWREYSSSRIKELASYCELNIDNYKVNEAYLAGKTAEQLLDLMQDVGMIDSEIRKGWEERSYSEAYETCMASPSMIGVPDDIRAAWEAMQKRG